MKDAFDKFQAPERGRFGDNEREQTPTEAARSNLIDLTIFVRNDNPDKKAIAVSEEADAPFASWKWLPRSLVEYEMRDSRTATVTLPRQLAREKGLI